jgi:hypothetical protein
MAYTSSAVNTVLFNVEKQEGTYKIFQKQHGEGKPEVLDAIYFFQQRKG